MEMTNRRREYWRRTVSLTWVLAVIWFVFTFVMGYFARELATIKFMGWPLSFYMAAQGSLIVYVVIIGYYAWRMRRLDRQYGVQEGDAQ